MHWLAHLIRTLVRRLPVPVAIGGGVVIAGAAAVAGFALLSGSGAAATPDYTSTNYEDDVLSDLGVSGTELLDETFDSLLPAGLSTAERDDAIAAISALVGAGDADELAAQLVRRLGAGVESAGSGDELIALLVAELNPGGEPMTVAELLAAAEGWAAMTSPNTLTVVSGQGDGALAAVETLSFETVAAVLDSAPADAPLVIGLGGIDGLEATVVPGVRWEVDEASASIGLWGRTGAAPASEAFLSLRWGGEPGPTVMLGLPAHGWTLADAGFEDDLGATALPDTTFLVAPSRSVLAPSEVSPAMWERVTADHPAPLDELIVEAGISALTSFDADVLPDAVTDFVTGGGGPLSVRASLGSSAGVIDGSSAPDTATLAIVMPGLDPPALPDWLEPSTELPWALTLTVGGQTDLDIGLEGGLDAALDGGRREFAARFEVSSTGGEARGQLVGDLRRPWDAPFGVDWLTLDDLVMTVDLDATSSSASFAADVWIADRQARLDFDLAADEEATSVELLASIDRLTSQDASTFLARVSGASLPDALPAVELTDVLVEVTAGDGVTVGIGAKATIADQQADVLLSVESVPPAGRGVVFGVALEEWALADALPALDGTPLDAVTFPPTALVVSTIDGTVEPGELSAPAARFFGEIGGGRRLTLSPGVSIHGELDLSGTELEGPLDALGLTGGRLPVVGTLPGSLLGMGSGSAGGGALDGLALEVQLGEISGAGLPDWFRRGDLSIVVSGQPSIGLQGSMTVLIDGEELTFNVGAEFARKPLGLELALYGELETERPWEAPFGVEWLTVNGATLELSIDPVGTVGLGFAGDVVIGSKDIQAALAVEITPAGVPTNLVVFGASEEGLSTTDLLVLQQAMADAAGVGGQVDASAYPELLLKDVELRFAPQASERLGVEAGFVLAGDVYAAVGGGAPSRFAYLDFRLTEQGLFADGRLNAWRVGPLEWSDIVLDLELSRSSAHFHLDGEVALFDLGIETTIDLDADSIVMAGAEALDELRVIIGAFEAVMDDPAGAIEQVPVIFADAGVPLEPWMEDFFAAIANLQRQGQAVNEAAIDVILNGGAIPLDAFPAGGEELICPAYAPQEDGGRCYTTLALVSEDGVPSGGTAPKCVAPNLLESGGRCYLIKPYSRLVCPSGYLPLVTDTSRCRKTTYPYNTRDKVRKYYDGTPRNGVAKSCGVQFSSGGRCYIVPPGQLAPAVPAGGADYVCPALAPQEEGGRCWVVTPGQAESGLGVEGVCKRYADVSCTLEDVVRANLLGRLVDRLVDRFDSW